MRNCLLIILLCLFHSIANSGEVDEQTYIRNRRNQIEHEIYGWQGRLQSNIDLIWDIDQLIGRYRLSTSQEFKFDLDALPSIDVHLEIQLRAFKRLEEIQTIITDLELEKHELESRLTVDAPEEPPARKKRGK